MSKHPRPDENRKIDKNVLMSIFKRMKREPLKVFIAKDFFRSEISKRRVYFNILIALGIIEQVPMIYFCGIHKSIKRNVKGYKFKNG